MLRPFWNKDDTCNACFAIKISGRAGLSTAQGGNTQSVHGVMTEVGQSMITTGFGWIVDLPVVYSEAKTQVLAFGSVPGQEQLSIRHVSPFTRQVYHRTCICGIQQKWLIYNIIGLMFPIVFESIENVTYYWF